MARSLELYFAWLFAAIGTLVSLFLSNIWHFEPCILCWYQRICLFPLAIILGIAAYKDFFDIPRYVLPQVVIGLVIALYQIAIQEIPGWNAIDICGAGPSCAEKYDIGLGRISIPMLSAAGFFVIGVLLLFSWHKPKKLGEKL